MEIKEISYQDRLPKNMVSKFNYFMKDFLKEYSDQLDKLDFNERLVINKEYEGDLEVYFVEFRFLKKGEGGFFSLDRTENKLFVSCNDELWGTVILE
ncbi:hypothetical protein [Streptococcus sp. M334]|uniref:hypothetical protein n=1 Tax=Streptococcus sp. M334 TaxID=563038 RepID=UPI0001F89D6D|nr:hypothetical protein [Streptococcus sp. M334]EFX57909.1 hypothetical protein HMPREF0851_01959 [Streptococcus sp. M334]